jgi:hypothetical protein
MLDIIVAAGEESNGGASILELLRSPAKRTQGKRGLDYAADGAEIVNFTPSFAGIEIDFGAFLRKFRDRRG